MNCLIVRADWLGPKLTLYNEFTNALNVTETNSSKYKKPCALDTPINSGSLLRLDDVLCYSSLTSYRDAAYTSLKLAN